MLLLIYTSDIDGWICIGDGNVLIPDVVALIGGSSIDLEIGFSRYLISFAFLGCANAR